MKPLITVIINTVNERPERLRKTIQSFKNQIEVDVHILVSTVEDDISIGIAKDMGCDHVICPDKGIYQQLNHAIKYIKGDWWSYSSGHDIALYDKLVTEYNCCIKNNAKVCYSAYWISYPDTNRKYVQRFYDYDYQKHLELGNFVNDCALIKTSLIKKYAPFRHEEFHNDSFYDFWLRVYEGEGNIFCYNPEPTWDYIQYSDSKHIVRKVNTEEVIQYDNIRDKMKIKHLKPELRIWQCRVSGTISSHFEPGIMSKFGFKQYTNPNEPCIFWGCYHEGDIENIMNHNSLAVILWAGSDTMREDIKIFKGLPHVKHIVSSKWNASDLDKLGIEYYNLPISIYATPNIKAEPLGNKIYIYTSEHDPDFYGKKTYDKLIEKYGIENFHICTCKSYSKEQIMEIYKDCFIGLRLLEHDGLSETVCELGLMGRKIVHNNNTPNSLNYETIEDVIQHVENEKLKKVYVDNKLHDDMLNFLNVDENWLYADFYCDTVDKLEQSNVIFKKVLHHKLGVAYSVFDDLEHLEQSIMSIKDNVDYITIIYQNISYTGNRVSYNVYNRLQEYLKSGLVNSVHEYKPNTKLSTKENETNKRNIGLQVCRANFCTHHISMDGDEIYVPEQFKQAKNIVLDYGYDASFIFSKTYYKTKKHVITPPESYHIPFIYTIRKKNAFKVNATIEGISADPSRIIGGITSNIITFEREFIEMHHLSYVRNDIERKLINKAAKLSGEKIYDIMESYNNFKRFSLKQKVYTENGTFDVKRLLTNGI